MQLTLGFSPCPNDTFIFDALANGRLRPLGFTFRAELHDVETLNQMAFEQKLDISKLSFYAYLRAKKHYSLLSSGAALGYGCGPLVIAAKPLRIDDMAGCRIALPGEWTTAHLLFRLWAPQAQQRFFVTYDQIFDALRTGRADCGVIIHESRFTFQEAGFQQVVDLGAWWEQQTGLPIPLGCIAARKRLPVHVLDQTERLIRQSILLSQENPDDVLPYIRQHAQEMTAEVLRAHIEMFVNDFTLDMGPKGRKAVAVLAERAEQAGLLT
ncbi:MAG: 1,4-dihydroxy-6-naphthoate synthase [Desulfobacteraceae bacterium]|nr:1,4-dihydroxy-6-naphthoate synthase [Desulfobacteraceae bacterium]